jgi:hypothetical protein
MIAIARKGATLSALVLHARELFVERIGRFLPYQLSIWNGFSGGRLCHAIRELRGIAEGSESIKTDGWLTSD